MRRAVPIGAGWVRRAVLIGADWMRRAVLIGAGWVRRAVSIGADCVRLVVPCRGAGRLLPGLYIETGPRGHAWSQRLS